MSRTVRLYEHHGPTSIFIDAEIGDGGEVIVSGQDIGEAPEKFYGDSDYEYWVHVPAAAKPALLAALQAELEARRASGGRPSRGDTLARLRGYIAAARSRSLAALGMADPVDTEILDLIEALYVGSVEAFNGFRDLLAKHGIKGEYGSYA